MIILIVDTKCMPLSQFYATMANRHSYPHLEAHSPLNLILVKNSEEVKSYWGKFDRKPWAAPSLKFTTTG